MSRVLIAVPPLARHLSPTVSVGGELSSRGHEVAWTGMPEVADAVLPSGATFLPLVGSLDRQPFDEMRRRGSGLCGPAALKFLWEEIIVPMAAATVAELLDLVEAFDPQVLVADQQALAGSIVARRLGIPWVTSATTSGELTDPLSGLPEVDAWVRAQLLELQLEAGISSETAASGDLRFSDDLIIAFTTEVLLGHDAAPGPNLRFVGPCIASRPDPTPFPWGWLDPDHRHVLVTLGTANAEVGERFLATAIDALAATSVQAVVVAPFDQASVPSAGADNILVRSRIPQLAVLEHMDAVITHGGHSTVCESLAQGLPMVLAPIRDDEPNVADQVVRAGAGVRVQFGQVDADELHHAAFTVLDDPSYRYAAAVVRRSFRDAGGAVAAADAIDELLRAKKTHNKPACGDAYRVLARKV